MTNVIRYKKIRPNAHTPTRANYHDAGIDLYATENAMLWPLNRILVHTGLAIEIPDGYYGRIAPRSGLAFKNGIDVLAGVIDSAYRGELCLILYNTSNKPFEINEGDRKI